MTLQDRPEPDNRNSHDAQSLAREGIRNVVQIRLRLSGPNGPELNFRGRVAWTSAALIEAGKRRISANLQPASRWASYVHRLRRASLPADTITKRHGEPHAGEHCLNRPAAPLTLIERRSAG